MPLVTRSEDKEAKGTYVVDDQTRLAFSRQSEHRVGRWAHVLESPPFTVKVRYRSYDATERTYRIEVPWCYFIGIFHNDQIDYSNTSLWFSEKQLTDISGRVKMPPCPNIMAHGRICHGAGTFKPKGPVVNQLRFFFRHFWESAFNNSSSGMKLVPTGFDRSAVRYDKEKILSEWERMNREGKKIRWRGYRVEWRSRTIKTLGDAMKHYCF